MPTTRSRLWCLPFAVACWQKQTYQNRRLLITIDGYGASLTGGWLPDFNDERIQYHSITAKLATLGEKYNAMHAEAIDGLTRADFIAMAPDDDWQAPDYLERRMRALLASDRDRIGCRDMLFYDAATARLRLFQPAPDWKPWWVCHGSLIIHRSVWQRASGGYPHKIGSGTDAAFQNKIADTMPALFDDWRGYVAVQHGTNTYRDMGGYSSPVWKDQPLLDEIMGADLPAWQAAWANRPGA